MRVYNSCSTPQHITKQHSTAQDSTKQNTTRQHKTEQYTTAQNNTRHKPFIMPIGKYISAQPRTGQRRKADKHYITNQNRTGQKRTLYYITS